MIELTPEFVTAAARDISNKAVETVNEGYCEEETKMETIASAAGFIGYETGRTMGVAAAALQAGYVEGYEAYAKEHNLDDEGRKRTCTAKPLSDCEKCQCNYCAKLERCKWHIAGVEETRKDDSDVPWPCEACKPGKMFRPCGNGEPDCKDYEEMDGTNYT